jgi:hypothetical protein
LRAAVAAAVLGLTVAAPAAPVPPADNPNPDPIPAPPPQSITAETQGGYARIVVTFPEPTEVSAAISGRVLTVKLEKPIDADIIGLTRKLSTYVSSVRRDADMKTYRFTLGVAAKVQTSIAGNRTALDLIPENYAGLPASLGAQPPSVLPATAPPAAIAQAVPEQAIAPQTTTVASAATADMEGDRAVFRFPQAKGRAIAVFERGETTWIVLDRHPPIDATTLFANIASVVTKAEAHIVGTAFVIRVRFQTPLVATVGEDDSALTVSFTAMADPPRAARFVRASANGLPQLRVEVSGAAPALVIRDPEAGDRLLVVPSRPGTGVPVTRKFVELETLPSTTGLAIVPHADDLSMSVSNGVIEVSRPAGLQISLL